MSKFPARRSDPVNAFRSILLFSLGLLSSLPSDQNLFCFPWVNFKKKKKKIHIFSRLSVGTISLGQGRYSRQVAYDVVRTSNWDRLNDSFKFLRDLVFKVIRASRAAAVCGILCRQCFVDANLVCSNYSAPPIHHRPLSRLHGEMHSANNDSRKPSAIVSFNL